jgi:uncharacterized protein (TIGR00255 family)
MSEAALLLSMTGFGEARHQDPRWTIQVEMRTVNNRHFKLSARISDEFSAMEGALEQLVRERVKRGTVQVSLRIDRPRRPEDYRLNLVALGSYRDQLRTLQAGESGESGGRGATIDLSQLLVLPGVVEEVRTAVRPPNEDWPEVARVVGQALDALEASRAQEGRAMADELIAMGRSIGEHLGRIAGRAPAVVQSYHRRITERVQALVAEQGVTVEPEHLIREVAILADRCDISEEVVRLRAHLAQYAAIIEEPESSGRRLEFLVQEMGREINTIGAKAGDVEISRSVVDVKALLEKIRELVQNVE